MNNPNHIDDVIKLFRDTLREFQPDHGAITFTLIIRDGKIQRVETTKSESLLIGGKP